MRGLEYNRTDHHEQAERLLSEQQRSLDELRTRTSVVLAASALTAGFLGDAGLEDGAGPFAVFAILFLAAPGIVKTSNPFPKPKPEGPGIPGTRDGGGGETKG